MVRGTGKFKQRRGGGRSFSKNLSINEDGANFGKARGSRNDDDDDSSEEEEDEESAEGSEEEGSEEEGGEELTRAERKQLKKKQADEKKKAVEPVEEEDEDLINPNHVQKKMTISDLNAPRELTRREREQKEKQEAKERYWKLHVQGKTAEAKSDLARLAKIRADREAAQAKRKAELEEKAAEAEAKKQAQLAKRKI